MLLPIVRDVEKQHCMTFYTQGNSILEGYRFPV